MTLNNIKTMKKDRGFTLVELLIVIVVIAILAAIVIVAYNGVQKKANTTSAQSSANSIMKKIEAANAVNQGYPKDLTTALYSTTLNADATSKISDTGISIVPSVIAAGVTDKTKAVQIDVCVTSSLGVGAKIWYYDFGTAAKSATFLSAGDTSGTCTALT